MNEYIKKLDLEKQNGKSLDMSKVCRLCFTHLLLVPLFEGDGLKHQLVKKIRKHLSLQVKDVEGMSPRICYKCACTLMDWDDLVATSLIADSRFRQYESIAKQNNVAGDQNYMEENFEAFTSFVPEKISRVYKKRKLKKPKSDVYVEVVYKNRQLEMLEENLLETDNIISGQVIADREESIPTLYDVNKDEEVATQNSVVNVDSTDHNLVVDEDILEPHEEIILANSLEDVNIPRRIDDESEDHSTEKLPSNVVTHFPEEVNLRTENISLGIDLSTGNIEPFSLLINGETYQFTGTNLTRYVLPDNDDITQPQILEELQSNKLSDVRFINSVKGWMGCEKNINILIKDNIDSENIESNQCIKRKQIFSDQDDSKTKKGELDLFNLDEVDTIQNSYPCTECDREFVSTRRLHYHIKYSHAPKENVCQYCGAFYKLKKDLETHLVEHIDMNRYMCATCSEVFSFKKQLREHQKVHKTEKTHTFSCATCGKMFQSRPSLTSHLKSHLPASILCSLCGKVLKTRDSLRQHMKVVHSDERPFPCPTPNCNKSFKTNAQLKGHVSVHTGERNYVCEACGSSFHNLTLLIQHKLSHSASKPYECHICSAAFNRRGNLTMHKKKHEPGYSPKYRPSRPRKDGEVIIQRPDQCVVQCTVCNKWLKSALTLKYHMGKHLKDKHPFDCEVCGQRFISSLSYKIHERIHTGEAPYTCPECDKTFRSRSCLNQHSLIHNDIFPHPCPFCDRAFKRLQSLLVHKRTHTGEKNFKCPICSRAFAEKGDMKKHQLTHNREKTIKP